MTVTTTLATRIAIVGTVIATANPTPVATTETTETGMATEETGTGVTAEALPLVVSRPTTAGAEATPGALLVAAALLGPGTTRLPPLAVGLPRSPVGEVSDAR